MNYLIIAVLIGLGAAYADEVPIITLDLNEITFDENNIPYVDKVVSEYSFPVGNDNSEVKNVNLNDQPVVGVPEGVVVYEFDPERVVVYQDEPEGHNVYGVPLEYAQETLPQSPEVAKDQITTEEIPIQQPIYHIVPKPGCEGLITPEESSEIAAIPEEEEEDTTPKDTPPVTSSPKPSGFLSQELPEIDMKLPIVFNLHPGNDKTPITPALETGVSPIPVAPEDNSVTFKQYRTPVPLFNGKGHPVYGWGTEHLYNNGLYKLPLP